MGMKVNGTSGLTFPDTTTLASAGQASVRAWVNFNGTGTVAIRAAYNVTSITDNGTGDYTVNFTTALPDANYSAVGSANSTGGSAIMLSTNSSAYNASAPTTTSCRFQTTSVAANNDCLYVSFAAFR
jgi:hypothetical protein